ncbi:acyltransferase family protein [Brucella gallinifaecis]|uniref:acyltransferase family protein n=1 Tax=Brucella gallinifaecis TaxID=215590 RepID=UPI00235EE03E|nr:acyltransferase family protein [Brucella gallinifaecis]
MNYRADIDGLRTIAVVAVILSHLNFLPGGYVGVDIFFVISGFLIAPRILSGLQSGNFSFVDFYTRRAKRLLPQLYALIAVCFIASYILFLPDEFMSFSKSALATVLYASNFYFFNQTGYFAADSITQPLLHTWSLSVEEQFYFIAPILIFTIYKLKSLIPGAALIGIISFLVCVLSTPYWTDANFFLLPFRSWEFILGSTVAYLPVTSKKINEYAAALGLTLILFSIATLSEGSVFPGINAAPVVIGTALIIWSGNKTFLARIITNPVMGLIGKASYSLYIWHWPLIVFYSYYTFGDVSLHERIILFITTFIVGFLFYFGWEEPIRKSKISVKKTALLTFSASLFVAFLSVGVIKTNGLPERLNDASRIMANSAKEKNYNYDKCILKVRKKYFDSDLSKLCKLGNVNKRPSFAIWGDSFAASIANGLSEEAKKFDLAGIQLTMHSCTPIINTEGWWDATRNICKEMNSLALKAFKTAGVKVVFIHGSWNAFNRKDYLRSLAHEWDKDGNLNPQDLINKAVAETLDALINEGITPVLISGLPTSEKNIISKLARQLQSGYQIDFKRNRASYTKVYDRSNIAFKRFPDIVTLDPMDLLCDKNFCDVARNGRSLTTDGSHLTKSGSLSLANMFAPVLQHLKENSY